MSSLKTFARAGLLSLMATQAGAAPLAQRFAACTGRLSAQMEHHWLMSRPSETIEARRKAMISLLEAVQRPSEGREVLAYRIEAKHAQAVLLSRATFNDDPADAHWAATRAEAEIAACAALLTG